MDDESFLSATSDTDEPLAEEAVQRRFAWLTKGSAVTLATLLLLSVILWGGRAPSTLGAAGLRSKALTHSERLATTVLDSTVPEYGTEWQDVISGTECTETQLTPKSGGSGGSLQCEESAAGRHFTFPVGMFDIDQQVVVPADTTIEGAANPNDPSDKTKKPDPSTQTYFVASGPGVSDANGAYCGTGGNMQQGDAQRLRVGFLLNSNTAVKNINFQGKDTVRPLDNGNLCGGGVFETPGCVSPGFGDGVGYGWEGKRTGCYDHTGQPNQLLLGDGNGARNIVIENVRLNDLYLPSDPSQYTAQGQASQVAVWTPMTQDGSAVSNVRITNLVSMLTRGDGINFHGNVQNAVVEDCYIANTGDDTYAFWGAYAELPTGVVFRNNVAMNPGGARDHGYGVCAAIYGAKDVEITGMKCYDISNQVWHSSVGVASKKTADPSANGCMAYVHDNWFGAIYPAGNNINIHDNEYYYMDNPTQEIPNSDRPWIRTDGNHAHVDYR